MVPPGTYSSEKVLFLHSLIIFKQTIVEKQLERLTSNITPIRFNWCFMNFENKNTRCLSITKYYITFRSAKAPQRLYARYFLTTKQFVTLRAERCNESQIHARERTNKSECSQFASGATLRHRVSVSTSSAVFEKGSSSLPEMKGRRGRTRAQDFFTEMIVKE